MRPNPEIAILTAMVMFSGAALAALVVPRSSEAFSSAVSPTQLSTRMNPAGILRHMGNAAGALPVARRSPLLTLGAPAPIVLVGCGASVATGARRPNHGGEGVQMARRRAGKAKLKGVASGRERTKGSAPAPESALLERLVAIERERDALLAALSLEQERRRKLEEMHAAARDRIAWALDSLQSILEAKG
jgi:hypothetical protein